MARIIILGASGSLGRHVAGQALAGGHQVSVVVRAPSKLPDAWKGMVQVHQADIATLPVEQLGTLVDGHGVVINTAGMVSDGKRFVALFAHIVEGIESVAPAKRPVAWFLAGAGLLDIGDSGRRGLDLPVIRKTYWPHAENFTRLMASSIDFRLLCPGPMVEQAPIGLQRLRTATDRLPVAVPASARWLPDLLLVALFASRVPEMIVPYADAAALMLANLEPAGALSRHRVGLALPAGMRGSKAHWTAPSPR